MLVGGASDMARVVACSSMKLALKRLVGGVENFAVAFLPDRLGRSRSMPPLTPQA